jgi:hypothetical protein
VHASTVALNALWTYDRRRGRHLPVERFQNSDREVLAAVMPARAWREESRRKHGGRYFRGLVVR